MARRIALESIDDVKQRSCERTGGLEEIGKSVYILEKKVSQAEDIRFKML